MPQTSPLDVSAYRDANVSDLPSMDTATTAQNPFARARWLQECMSGAGGWAQAPSALTLNGVISTAGSPAQASWNLGTFQLVANATVEQVIELWIHCSAFASSTHLQMILKQPTGGSLTTSPPSATGWTRYVLQPLSSGGQWQVLLQLDPAYPSATPSLTIDSICFLQNPGTSAPAAFPIRYLPNLAANRPDDVDTVAAIDHQLSFVQETYPRTLASHNLTVGTIAGGIATSFMWKVRRGPNIGSVDFWVYVSSAVNTALLEMFIDGTHVDPVNPQGSGVSLTGTTGSVRVSLPNIVTGLWVGFTLPAGWTANTASEVKIVASDPGGDAIGLEEVIATEENFTPSTFLVNDGRSPPLRMDNPPQRLILPAASGLNSNQPIIGSFWEQSSPPLQVQWNDRRTAMKNAIYQAIYRSQVLIFDRLSPGTQNLTNADFGNLVDDGSLLPAPTVARWKHQTRRGAANASVAIKASVAAMLYPNAYLIGLSLNVDGTYYGLNPISPTSLPGGGAIPAREQWITIGTYPVIENHVHDVQLLAGFMTSNGEGLGTTVQGVLTIDGVQIVEIPPPAVPSGSTAAFYSLPAASSATIPPNDSALGVSKSTVVGNGPPTVRHVRFWAQCTTAGFASLAFKLSNGTRTVTVTPVAVSAGIAVTPASGALFGYSDDVMGDAGVANPLADFIGDPAFATWTLNVTQPTSATGTFDQFGLELT